MTAPSKSAAFVNWQRCPHNGKRCYPTRKAVTEHGREHGSHGRGYRCPHCGLHHFTSQPKHVSRAIQYLLESLS